MRRIAALVPSDDDLAALRVRRRRLDLRHLASQEAIEPLTRISGAARALANERCALLDRGPQRPVDLREARVRQVRTERGRAVVNTLSAATTRGGGRRAR